VKIPYKSNLCTSYGVANSVKNQMITILSWDKWMILHYKKLRGAPSFHQELESQIVQSWLRKLWEELKAS
jgi:hypothetical protein